MACGRLFMEVISGDQKQSEICSLDVETWSFLEYCSSSEDNETEYL